MYVYWQMLLLLIMFSGCYVQGVADGTVTVADVVATWLLAGVMLRCG